MSESADAPQNTHETATQATLPEHAQALNPKQHAAMLFRRASYILLALSIVNGLYLSRTFLRGLPDNASFTGLLFFWWAVLASVLFWHVMILIPTNILRVINHRLAIGSAVCLCCLFNIALIIDASIYSLYGFHLNGIVWNILTTPGAGDSYSLGASTILTAILYLASIIAWIWGGYLLCRKLKWLQNWQPRRALSVLIICSLVVFVISDKVLQVVGDITASRNITRTRSTTPFHIKSSMQHFLRENFDMKFNENAVKISQSSLKYPRKELQFSGPVKTPNILTLFIEGARWDCLTPECMPNITAFGKKNIVANNHLSGGCATRLGIFSGLYGLVGPYWTTALNDRTSPLLFDVLQKHNYSFEIFASTDLNFPEFRQTAFVKIPEQHIHDDLGSDKVIADTKISDGLIKLAQSKEPWYGFALYDASHQPYRYTDEDNIFPVENRDINYATLPNKRDFDINMFNQYRNSLHFVDRQIGRILDELERSGVLENTIVFIAGDHGEAFGEVGHFGHANTFTRYQTQTLAVWHIPGQVAQSIDTLTTHYDVPATILEYMGCSNDPADHSNGRSIFSKEATRDPIILTSLSRVGVVIKDHFVVTSYRGSNMDLSVYDRNWQEIPDPDSFMRDNPGSLQYLLKACNQFR